MDLILLKDFFISYSLPTVIIAICVAVAVLILEKIFKEKLPFSVLNYLPFALSILVYFVYGLIISNGKISSDPFYAGILSGSLSTVIRSAIRRIGQGKSIGASATILLIESLLRGYVDENSISATAVLIDEILSKREDLNEDLVEKTTNVLINNANKTSSKEQIESVASLIVNSVKALKR